MIVLRLAKLFSKQDGENNYFVDNKNLLSAFYYSTFKVFLFTL